MNDTRKKASQRIRTLMKKKSAQDRLMMGFSMFDAAKLLVIESLKAKTPLLNPRDLKERLFLRFYGNDFNHDTKKKILNNLRRKVA